MSDQKLDQTAAKAVVVDALSRGSTVAQAAELAGAQVRTLYNWRNGDPLFASAWEAAVEDSKDAADHRVTSGAVAKWRESLERSRAAVAEVEKALGEIAAPSLMGDPGAQERQRQLRAELTKARADCESYSAAIQSGERHLAARAAEKAAAAKQAAAIERDDLHAEQLEAAQQVDQALSTLAEAWGAFVEINAKRQSAARRAGGNARAAYQTQLQAAVFSVAPTIADALQLARLRRGSCLPLSKAIR